MKIEIAGVSAQYGTKPVLKDVSVTFAAGQVTGLIGPNGSGKSTLLKCIYRILKPSGGRILLGERELSTLSHRESARETAVLAQHHSAAFDFSVRDVVLMGRTPYKGITEGDSAEDVEIARRAMRETGVLSMERDSFARLSGGEQQRVMLARALTQETPCLILDEPTNHLDITYQLQIMDLIAARRLTVIAAVHDLNIAAMYCDRIVALQEGRIIAEGTPDEVLTPALIERLYRVRASVFARADGRPAVVYERGARG